MKERNGFVSNSSSSSFVVMLPNKIYSRKDFDKLFNQHFPSNLLKNAGLTEKDILNRLYEKIKMPDAHKIKYIRKIIGHYEKKSLQEGENFEKFCENWYLKYKEKYPGYVFYWFDLFPNRNQVDWFLYEYFDWGKLGIKYIRYKYH